MPAPVVLGVCSGLSIHLGVPVRTVRWIITLSSAFFGAGAALYLWLAATVPLDDPESAEGSSEPVTRLRNPLAKMVQDTSAQAVAAQLLIAGGIFLVLATATLLAGAVFGWEMNSVGSVAAVVGGLILLWGQVPNLAQWRSPRVWVAGTAGVSLLLAGIILFLSRDYPARTLMVGSIIGVLIAAAILAALIPVWVALISGMTTSRSREAREAERADIAAHLHDSVLQTLTLIRAAADDPLRVRSLALTQERELRAWLYTGREDPGNSVTQILRERISGLETTHGIEVSLVAVGDTVPGPAELAAVAAAGEATHNALRHGHAPISVYLEVSPRQLEVFIKDAGPGFDVNNISSDRHGIRESIIGRVKRVGGAVTIRTGYPSRAGTEVQIRVPLTDPSEPQQQAHG